MSSTGEIVWTVTIHSVHHLSQSQKRQLRSPEYPGVVARVIERGDATAYLTAAEAGVVEEPESRQEMLLGAYEIAAPITHHYLQQIPERQNGWASFAEGKLQSLIGERTRGRQFTSDPGSETFGSYRI